MDHRLTWRKSYAPTLLCILLGSVVLISSIVTMPSSLYTPTAHAAEYSTKPTTVFLEDFENGVTGNSPVKLADYQGLVTTYDADEYWMNVHACNGLIVSSGMSADEGICSPEPEQPEQPADPDDPDNPSNPTTPATDVKTDIDTARVRAYALGMKNSGAGSAATNHALTENTYTAAGKISGNTDEKSTLLFATARGITSTSDGTALSQYRGGRRFYNIAVDVASTYCSAASTEDNPTENPVLKLGYTINGGTETSLSGKNGTDICTLTALHNGTDEDLTSTFADESKLDARVAKVRLGTLHGITALKVDENTQSVGLTLRNTTTTATDEGNDVSVDNVRLEDVTPQLTKSFEPAQVPSGGVSRLTFTITNKDDNATKEGWSFTDELPAGLTLASIPDIYTTCGGSVDAGVDQATGRTRVTMTNGILRGGVIPTCVVSVNVSAQVTRETTYANGPDNLTVDYLDEPADDATVTFTPTASGNEDSVEITPAVRKWVDKVDTNKYKLQLAARNVEKTTTEKTMQGADVVLIVDRSSSMHNTVSGTNRTRWQVLQNAVRTFTNNVDSRNAQTADNPDAQIRMSLVEFGTFGAQRQGWTTSGRTILNSMSSTPYSNDSRTSDYLYGGTNWESAFIAANDYINTSNRDVPKYYIFVSDGEPTFRRTGQGSTVPSIAYNRTNPYYQPYAQGWNYNGCVSTTRYGDYYGTCSDDTTTIRNFYGTSRLHGEGNRDSNKWNYNAAVAEARDQSPQDSHIFTVSTGTEALSGMSQFFTDANAGHTGTNTAITSNLDGTSVTGLADAFTRMFEAINTYHEWDARELSINDQLSEWVIPSDWDPDYSGVVTSAAVEMLEYHDDGTPFTNVTETMVCTTVGETNCLPPMCKTGQNPDTHWCIQVRYKAEDRTITAVFPQKYRMLAGYVYRLNFDVEPSAAAHQYFASNGHYPFIRSTSNETTGEENSGSTSENYAGFYSNTDDGAYLSYRIYKDDKPYEDPKKRKYKHPVVQVEFTSDLPLTGAKVTGRSVALISIPLLILSGIAYLISRYAMRHKDS